MSTTDLSLPSDVRLLHIGPHKTGTSAIQSAFHMAREALAEHGIVYAARRRQPKREVHAATGRKGMLGQPEPSLRLWDRMVDEVAAAGDRRVVVSCEHFADADDEAIHRIVESLGGPRVHVVVTLRPLAKIMPSQWQQYVQNGLRLPYEEWLDAMLNKPPYNKPNPTFWRRHRHDQLIDRWASVVGAENVTVIVVDESNPRTLMSRFESLLALPEGLLVPEVDRVNRSLSYGEAELVRHFNREFRRLGWQEKLYDKHMRKGAIRRMKTAREPGPDETRVTTPAWALERAAAIGAESAEKIATLGVRVLGDLAVLARAPLSPPPAAPPLEALPSPPAEAAAQAVIGAIVGQGDIAHPERCTCDPSQVSLRRVLSQRARRAVRRAAAGRQKGAR